MRLSGFGSNIPPVRRWENSMQTRSPASAYRNTGGSEPLRTVQQIQHQQAQRLFTPTFAVEPAGYGMMPPANQGDAAPASGLKGLSGYAQSFGCDAFDQALDTLGEVVTRGERAGLSSPNFLQAQRRWEDETSLLRPWARTAVYPTNCKAQAATLLALISAVNKELSPDARVIVPATVVAAGNAQQLVTDTSGKPPEEMSFTAKFAIVGGVVAVGLVAVAVITGQVAPLLKTVKKVVS